MRGIDWYQNEWPWPLFRLRGRFKVTLCQPLPHIHHWISRKPLEMEAWFQMTINRKLPMTNRMVTWPITSRYTPERSNSWSQYAQKTAGDTETPLERNTMGSGLWGIKWSRDWWRHVTVKGQVVTPIRLSQYFENNWRCYLTTIANY